MTDTDTGTDRAGLFGGSTPKHEYDLVSGTEPSAFVEHEPRTLAHAIRVDSHIVAAHMMTEIGDGCFVQWSQCSKCAHSVAECTCSGGPVPPTYIERWLPKRFAGSLDARPNPEYKMLPTVISWVRERGFVVKPKGEPDPASDDLFVKLYLATAACEPEPGQQLDDVLTEFQAEYDRITGHVTGEALAVQPGDVITEADGVTVDAAATFATENNPLVDAGIDAAIEAVQPRDFNERLKDVPDVDF